MNNYKDLYKKNTFLRSKCNEKVNNYLISCRAKRSQTFDCRRKTLYIECNELNPEKTKKSYKEIFHKKRSIKKKLTFKDRPPFIVGIVKHKIYSPPFLHSPLHLNAEKKKIVSTPLQSFAPKNYKFKAPKGLTAYTLNLVNKESHYSPLSLHSSVSKQEKKNLKTKDLRFQYVTIRSRTRKLPNDLPLSKTPTNVEVKENNSKKRYENVKKQLWLEDQNESPIFGRLNLQKKMLQESVKNFLKESNKKETCKPTASCSSINRDKFKVMPNSSPLTLPLKLSHKIDDSLLTDKSEFIDCNLERKNDHMKGQLPESLCSNLSKINCGAINSSISKSPIKLKMNEEISIINQSKTPYTLSQNAQEKKINTEIVYENKITKENIAENSCSSKTVECELKKSLSNENENSCIPISSKCPNSSEDTVKQRNKYENFNESNMNEVPKNKILNIDEAKSFMNTSKCSLNNSQIKDKSTIKLKSKERENFFKSNIPVFSLYQKSTSALMTSKTLTFEKNLSENQINLSILSESTNIKLNDPKLQKNFKLDSKEVSNKIDKNNLADPALEETTEYQKDNFESFESVKTIKKKNFNFEDDSLNNNKLDCSLEIFANSKIYSGQSEEVTNLQENLKLDNKEMSNQIIVRSLEGTALKKTIESQKDNLKSFETAKTIDNSLNNNKLDCSLEIFVNSKINISKSEVTILEESEIKESNIKNIDSLLPTVKIINFPLCSLIRNTMNTTNKKQPEIIDLINVTPEIEEKSELAEKSFISKLCNEKNNISHQNNLISEDVYAGTAQTCTKVDKTILTIDLLDSPEIQNKTIDILKTEESVFDKYKSSVTSSKCQKQNINYLSQSSDKYQIIDLVSDDEEDTKFLLQDIDKQTEIIKLSPQSDCRRTIKSIENILKLQVSPCDIPQTQVLLKENSSDSVTASPLKVLELRNRKVDVSPSPKKTTPTKETKFILGDIDKHTEIGNDSPKLNCRRTIKFLENIPKLQVSPCDIPQTQVLLKENSSDSVTASPLKVLELRNRKVDVSPSPKKTTPRKETKFILGDIDKHTEIGNDSPKLNCRRTIKFLENIPKLQVSPCDIPQTQVLLKENSSDSVTASPLKVLELRNRKVDVSPSPKKTTPRKETKFILGDIDKHTEIGNDSPKLNCRRTIKFLENIPKLQVSPCDIPQTQVLLKENSSDSVTASPLKVLELKNRKVDVSPSPKKTTPRKETKFILGDIDKHTEIGNDSPKLNCRRTVKFLENIPKLQVSPCDTPQTQVLLKENSSDSVTASPLRVLTLRNRKVDVSPSPKKTTPRENSKFMMQNLNKHAEISNLSPKPNCRRAIKSIENIPKLHVSPCDMHQAQALLKENLPDPETASPLRVLSLRNRKVGISPSPKKTTLRRKKKEDTQRV